MTLQHLKYALEIADRGSMNEAAKRIFLSQPSLSAAIKELETELRFPLFVRTNRGVVVSPEGEEFLGYARQVAQQAALLEEKYLRGAPAKQRFSVSTQHYAFTANAFVDLIKEFGGEAYEFALRETRTWDIIDDVRGMRSELGVLYLSAFNESVLMKLLKENGLVFSELFAVRPHIFVRRGHPLAEKGIISLAKLEDFPCLSIDQGDRGSFYFAEEALSTLDHKKHIKVTDRAALVNLLIGLDAYVVSTGVLPADLHSERIMSLPLDTEELLRVGVVTHKDVTPSRLGESYLGALRRIAEEVGHG
jgi:DNA-binding transcriptional LysR family regulator